MPEVELGASSTLGKPFSSNPSPGAFYLYHFISSIRDSMGSRKGSEDPRLAVCLAISPSANEGTSLGLGYGMGKIKA